MPTITSLIDRAATRHPKLRSELSAAEDLVAYGFIRRTCGRHFIVTTPYYQDTAHVDLGAMSCTCADFYYGTVPVIYGYTLCSHLIAALLLDLSSPRSTAA